MTFLIQLRNRANTIEVADQVILEANTDTEKLISLTNALLQKQSTYIFYYKNKRVISTLEPIVEEFSLNPEELIVIDFIDEKDILADSVVELDDTVVSICTYCDKIYYLTYGGDVFQLGKTEKMFSKISRLAAGSNLLGADDCRVYDIIKNESIHTFEQQIRSLSSFCSLTAVATSSEILIIDQSNSNVKKIADSQKLPRAITISTNIVAWISDYNQIHIYNLDNSETHVYKTDCTVIDLCITNDFVVATTSNNKVLTVFDNKIHEIKTDQRSIQHALYLNNQMLLASQYNIISCSFSSPSKVLEHAFLKVNGNINGMAVDTNSVYIANDNKIAIFSVQRLHN